MRCLSPQRQTTSPTLLAILCQEAMIPGTIAISGLICMLPKPSIALKLSQAGSKLGTLIYKSLSKLSSVAHLIQQLLSKK